MHDLMNILSVQSVINPQAAIKTTTASAAIDVTALNSGNDGLVVAVSVGVVTDGTHTFSLQDSIDGGATYQPVAALYQQTPAGQNNVVTAATAAGSVLKFGYLGNPNVGGLANSTESGAPPHKVLVQVVDTVTGAPATGGLFSAVAILGYPVSLPAA